MHYVKLLIQWVCHSKVGLSVCHLRVTPVRCTLQIIPVVSVSTDIEVQIILTYTQLLHWTSRTLSWLTLMMHRNWHRDCILVCGREGIKHNTTIYLACLFLCAWLCGSCISWRKCAVCSLKFTKIVRLMFYGGSLVFQWHPIVTLDSGLPTGT